MSATQLLSDLRAQGIQIALAGPDLVIDAPPGFITPELQNELRLNKKALVKLLSTPMLPLFAPPPARWVFPEVAAGFADLDPAGWPLSLYWEGAGQWVEFANYEALQAASLPAPATERTP